MYYYCMCPPYMPCTYQPYPCPMNYYDREEDDDKYDEDLKYMYPKMYFKLSPMVEMECNKLEKKHGEMYCPTKQDIDCICNDVYNKLKPQFEELGDDNDDDDENCYRRRRYGRRRALYDLTTILLLDRFRRCRRCRRRKKRRRRRPRRYYY